MTELLSKTEIEERYGVTCNTFNNWIKKGAIFAASKRKCANLYDAAQVEELLKTWKPRRKNTPAQIETIDTPPATAEPVTTDTESAIVDETTDNTAIETADATADDRAAENTPSTDTTPAVIVDESAAVDVELGKHAEKIRVLCEAIRLNSISVGFELIAAKKLVEHGRWGQWLADNFSDRYGLTEKTAENYIKVAKRFGGNSNFADVAYSKLLAMTKLPPGTEQDFLIEQASEGRSIANQSARQVKKSVAAFCAAATAQVETVDEPATDTTPAVDATAETTVDATTDTPAVVDVAEKPESADIENLLRQIDALRRENDVLKRENDDLRAENDELKSELAARDTTPE